MLYHLAYIMIIVNCTMRNYIVCSYFYQLEQLEPSFLWSTIKFTHKTRVQKNLAKLVIYVPCFGGGQVATKNLIVLGDPFFWASLTIAQRSLTIRSWAIHSARKWQLGTISCLSRKVPNALLEIYTCVNNENMGNKKWLLPHTTSSKNISLIHNMCNAMGIIAKIALKCTHWTFHTKIM